MAETIGNLATEFENLIKLKQEKRSSVKEKEKIDNFKSTFTVKR